MYFEDKQQYITVGVHAGVAPLEFPEKHKLESDDYYVASAITDHVFKTFILPKLHEYDQ